MCTFPARQGLFHLAMSSKEVQKRIKALLAVKSFAEVVDLSIEHLRAFPNDIPVMLGLASAYYGVAQFQEAVSICNRILSLEQNNLFALHGLMNSYERLKKYPEYYAALVKVLSVLHHQDNPTEYWKELKKGVEFFKSHSKFQDAVNLIELSLKNPNVILFLSADLQGKPTCKRLDLLKELEGVVEKKKQIDLNAKKDVLQDIAKLANISEQILIEVEKDKSPLSKLKVNNAKLKLVERNYQIFTSEQSPKAAKHQAALILKQYANELPSLSKEYPFDEIYFDFAHMNFNYLNLNSIVNNFYAGKVDSKSQNNSLLMNCWYIYSLVQQHNYEKALKTLQKAKSFFKQNESNYMMSSDNVPFEKSAGFSTLLLLEGLIYFHLDLFVESFELLDPLRDYIINLKDFKLNCLYVQLLNEKGLFEDAIHFCDLFDNLQLEKGWTMFLMGNTKDSLQIFTDSNLTDSSINQYRLGRIYFQIGRFDEALRQFESSVQIDSSMYESFAYIGRIYLAEHQVEQAKVHLRLSLEKKFDKNSVAIESLSDILKGENNFAELIELNKKFLQCNPRDLLTLRNLALGYYKVSNVNECISCIHLSLRIDFRNAESWELLGECYFKEGRYHAALKALERALEIEPSLPYASLFIAFIQDKLKLYPQSIERLTTLIDNPVVGTPALCYLLDVYLDIFNQQINYNCFGIAFNKLQECLNILQEKTLPSNHYSIWRFLAKLIYYSTVLYPQFPLNFANIFQKLGISNCSLDDCINRAIQLCTDSKIKAVLCNDLAIYFSNEQAFLTAIELDPWNDDFWSSLGVFYLKNNRVSLAIQSFKIVLQRNPKNVSCWINLGFLYLSIGNTKIALNCFEEGQRLAPLNSSSWIGQYLINSDREHLIHSIEICTEFVPEFLFLIGKFYFDEYVKSLNNVSIKGAPERETNGLLSKAFVSFSQYLLSDPKSIECLTYLGLISELLYQPAIAFQYLERALSICSTGNQEISQLKLNYARVLAAQHQFIEASKLFEECKLNLYDKMIHGIILLSIDQQKSLKLFGECYKEANGNLDLTKIFIRVLYKSGNAAIAKQQAMNLLKSTCDLSLLIITGLLAVETKDDSLFWTVINKIESIESEHESFD